ncbi:GNAT family N-acetyltransferase [Muricoccus aerilatus]|uniref:GNAT family N-acetyltransferase n=1 Tax=Muricoccus aerilatus TaxID=452982 RepID=UPI0005C23C92|nr:GNAT family N-acetyltransferase [Roseomonas aerilata]
MPIRDATTDDAAAIAAIYAHHVLHGTGTFEETPPAAEEVAARMARIQAAGHAWLVAEEDDAILGYAYYTNFHARSAYRHTVENSIYVRDNVRGQGVGKGLVAELLVRAEAAGFRQMIAVIGDSENVGSIGLHLSLGFKQAGLLRAVGLKFGRWVDVVYMQKALGEADRTLPG